MGKIMFQMTILIKSEVLRGENTALYCGNDHVMRRKVDDNNEIVTTDLVAYEAETQVIPHTEGEPMTLNQRLRDLSLCVNKYDEISSERQNRQSSLSSSDFSRK
eukprot:gnl/Chilomastix_caulleri/3040.p1 GENE.gnl/Chilomastix_caulleri/3040~~gnl/Chilomastix_caulleri/3040.p1  ORF type:complete len:104 (+),score=21.55 gnl/Chilomastix_caulleri/3040:250-561(+)